VVVRFPRRWLGAVSHSFASSATTRRALARIRHPRAARSRQGGRARSRLRAREAPRRDRQARGCARRLLDIASRWPYPERPYFDDALYHASEIEEALGRPRRRSSISSDCSPIGRRRASSGATSARYTPALLRIAEALRRALHDRARARETLHRLYVDSEPRPSATTRSGAKRICGAKTATPTPHAHACARSSAIFPIRATSRARWRSAA
jgi:hypothetical protein